MAIAVYFHPKDMTLRDFEETHRRLAEIGAAQPEGRIHHSCFGEDGSLMVYQIWESPEAFEAFGETLMPLLSEVGIDPGEPSIMAVHRLEQTTIAPSSATAA
jgi:hypothetical protein